ncbi:hypothetical protein BCR34DRAFT_476852 [Clohesyomyces aquaticus]|uniref:Uncharacterized protein n=1 Tax=Clohesyomyces aquaticus TaxID=1231657 RepID=A0A1Y2A0R5_9PLEO|nr:hypothetical protein BCR34DRAFT_476852 [Clohesyomyces aquaticus]
MSSLFGVAPSNHTAWRPEPRFRGTASILSTCLTTMILCVWTAVHLNIPEPGKNKGILTPQNRRKIVFLLTGLFAPELVRHDWAVISMLTYHTKPFELDHISPQPRHEWTLTHSFYAIMGGFVIDLSKERIEFLADKKHTRLTLNISALLWVAEWGPDVIPDLAEGEIQDKSKANGLAKTLVFLQAIWFCVQCINRLVQGLAISLLELNTFAHALCTLVIYVLWWNKPLDIEEPTSLQGPRARGATALVLSDSLSASSRFLRTKGISLALHAKNLPPYFWGNENKSVSIYASLVLASLSYGAIHMAAWNAPFPSHIQQLLWRISSTSLAGFGILCLCPLVFEYIAAKMELEVTWRDESKRRRIKDVLSRFVAFLYLLYRLAGFLLCALYFFGRIYLFVECFVAIPNLPDSVYEVPAWSRYFPHIS